MDSQKASRREKIAVVVGTRPNYMKAAPLMRMLKEEPFFEPVLIHTNQHYDKHMAEDFFEELGIHPDFVLDPRPIGPTHADLMVRIAPQLERLLRRVDPDLVVVVGDVDSTMIAAIVAKKLKIQVAHVEAGLRSGDQHMPEEINRLVVDSISDLYFCTEMSGFMNLAREKKIPFMAGNLMIDNLLWALPKRKELPFNLVEGEFAFMTLHRPSNVDDKETLSGILQAIAKLDMKVVFPVHPRTAHRMREMNPPANVSMIHPLSFIDSVTIWSRAKLVITDSGGLQEETTFMKIPCVTVRWNTERPVTLEHTNVLAGNEPTRLLKAIKEQCEADYSEVDPPELWDGHAAARIVDLIKEHFRRIRV